MPDPAPTFTSSQGTTFTFKGNTYKCLDISRDMSAPARERIDMTTLDVAHGGDAVMALSPIKPKRDPDKFTITYRMMSNTVAIASGSEGTLVTADGTGTFRVTAATTPRKVGQYVEATATFEELIADEVSAAGLTIT